MDPDRVPEEGVPAVCSACLRVFRVVVPEAHEPDGVAAFDLAVAPGAETANDEETATDEVDAGDADVVAADVEEDLGLREADRVDQEAADVDLDLAEAELGDVDLGDTELGDVDLGDTELGEVDLGEVDLGEVDPGDIDLGEVDLEEVDLGEEDLEDPGSAAVEVDLAAELEAPELEAPEPDALEPVTPEPDAIDPEGPDPAVGTPREASHEMTGGEAATPAPPSSAPPTPSTPGAASAPPAASDGPGPGLEGTTLSRGMARFGRRDPRERARRLARVLVSDMITYHPARYEEGLENGTLRELFEDEVEKSWKEFVDQVGEELAESSDDFVDALNEILARGQILYRGPGRPR